MKGHIAANESLMPIFGIEVTPVPITLLLQPKSSQWEEAQKNAKSVGGKSHGAPSSKSADTSHLYVGDAATTTSGPEDPYVGTTDIFMRLAIHLSDGRTRLLEIFRQEDKNCDQSLNSAELAGLLRRVYPGITPAQVRYMQASRRCSDLVVCARAMHPQGSASCGGVFWPGMRVQNPRWTAESFVEGHILSPCPLLSLIGSKHSQVMLDKQGDDKITYRQLSETIKLCKKAGVQVKAREGLELVDVLRQLAMKQIRETLSVKELFDCYDTTKSGFMGKSQVQRMITTLMPAANTHEVSDMADAFWGIDFNGDNRISRDEFSKAMKQGGADILDLRSSNPLETGVAGFEAAELQAGAAHAGIQLGKPRDNKKGDPGPLEDASPMEDLGNGSAVKELMFQVR